MKPQGAFFPLFLYPSCSSHDARLSPWLHPSPQKRSEHCLGPWIHFLFIAQMNDLRAIKKEECNPCVENWGFPWQQQKDSRECPCIPWICKKRLGPVPGQFYKKFVKRSFSLGKKNGLVVIKNISPSFFTHEKEQKAKDSTYRYWRINTIFKF